MAIKHGIYSYMNEIKKKHKYSENVYKCFPCSQFVYLVRGKMQKKMKNEK